MLLDAAGASLSTIHIENLPPQKASEMTEKIDDLSSQITTLQEYHETQKFNLNEGQKLWLAFEDEFRRLKNFCDRASQFDNMDKKVPIDPIQWKSESARIKTLLQEREGLKNLPEKLEENISEISKLCNCETDSSRTKIATMGILLESLPVKVHSLIIKILRYY